MVKKKLEKKRPKRTITPIRKRRLRFHLAKAGVKINYKKVSRNIFVSCVILNLVISGFLMYYFSTSYGYTIGYVIVMMLVLWLFIFVILLFISWVAFYIFLDLRIFKRRAELEDVLPDFLQLASANIRAGMTIDKALWYAVRPRFGILAKEIEAVAKETMSGEDLRDALKKFSRKYDSMILKRAISLLIEGINAGGEMGGLLDKISSNIQEVKIMRKDMAANVSTYVIFIAFTTLLAAPFLFALANQLIIVVKTISGSVTIPKGVGLGLPISFAGIGITPSDFRLFAIISLLITSLFSAMIIATIKKGSVKGGVKYIPIFMIVTVILFFIARIILDSVFSNFF